MKASEVLSLLKVTRPTLTRYVKLGIIEATKKPSGHYEYDENSVYKFLNRDVPRKTVIYCRVSTSKQKKDLENQVHLAKTFCLNNGIQLSALYTDVASGISFEKRKEFFMMLDEILAYRVERVVITYKDRLSRVGFGLFKYLFKKFGTEIVVISEIGSETLDSKEVFDEIVSLLHCYSMKLYTSRKKKVVEKLCVKE